MTKGHIFILLIKINEEAMKKIGISSLKNEKAPVLSCVMNQETALKKKQNKKEAKELEIKDVTSPLNKDLNTVFNNLIPFNDNANIFYSYLDKNEKFKFTCSKYCKIFSMPVSNIINKPLKSLIGKKAYKLQKTYLCKAYSGSIVTFEYPWEDANKYSHFLRLRYVPVKSENGEVRGIFSFMEELDRKKN